MNRGLTLGRLRACSGFGFEAKASNFFLVKAKFAVVCGQSDVQINRDNEV